MPIIFSPSSTNIIATFCFVDYHTKLEIGKRGNNKKCLWIQLMCAHIKLSIFGNIFSKIEKAVNTFSILEKIFSKNENYYVPLGHTLTKSFFNILVSSRYNRPAQERWFGFVLWPNTINL